MKHFSQSFPMQKKHLGANSLATGSSHGLSATGVKLDPTMANMTDQAAAAGRLDVDKS